MEINDFEVTYRKLLETGCIQSRPSDNIVHIRVKDAKNVLLRGFRWSLGENASWLPEYDFVADWLTDNHGRGLLMYGQCGRGKSVLGWRIIPQVLNFWCHKIVTCVNAQELNESPDEIIAKHIIYVDDIGTESVSVKYGNKRQTFPELVDAAERHGKLLIVSTNFTLQELSEQYGERTTDRLRAITKQVLFLGNSLRK
jgi:DNA replication protein DnaC